MNVQHTHIELAKAADLPGVETFYEKVGYSCGVCVDDRIVVARDEQAIVAAVRLCEEEGVLVARGMYVAKTLRRKGLGASLLERTSLEIGEAECWCVPYAHLMEFYSRAGFVVCDNTAAPDFLIARLKSYSASGKKVAIMRRPPR